MKPSRRTEGRKALDLLEEAVLLLRELPFLSWARLYIGVLPFALVFLVYLMNLAHNPRASEQLVGYSAVLAILYVWLKIWQTAFAAEVWRARAGMPAFRWSFGMAFRIAGNHLRYSAVSLAGLAGSALLVIPFAWHYALHQNLVLQVLPGSEKPQGPPAILRRSWQQARLWPGQNYLVILLLGLISLFVFLNFAACLVAFPYLIKMLTGWESTFTRLGARLLDFKMLVAAVVLTYLAMLPLARVVYVLRCFYGSSLRTGADLLSELRSTVAAALILACLFLAGNAQALASAPSPEMTRVSASAAVAEVSPSRLDASINSVLEARKHLWQAPRNARKPDDSSIWRDVGRAITRWIEKLLDWIGRILRWLLPDSAPARKPGGTSINIRDVAIVLLIVCAIGVAVLITRSLLDRRSQPKQAVAAGAAKPVDLRQAELSPEELPEEKWLDLAREMMESGQARLAIRAIYLAAIVILGKRELVTPTRFKSNRDYLLELKRRHRGGETPLASFQSMIGLFEKVWYGRHDPAHHDFEEMHRLLAALRA